jgi:hypothetical protein
MSKNIEKLNIYREKIEGMNKLHQIEVLKIFLKYPDISLSENRNGTFINLSGIDDKVMDEIEKYVYFYEMQEKQIGILETKKEQLQNEFFTDLIN